MPKNRYLSDVYKRQAMGSPLSLVAANLCMEYFEKVDLETAELKPTLWLHNMDDNVASVDILWVCC